MQIKKIENKINNLERTQILLFREIKTLQKEVGEILGSINGKELKKSFIKRIEKASVDAKKGKGKEFKNIKELKRYLSNL